MSWLRGKSQHLHSNSWKAVRRVAVLAVSALVFAGCAGGFQPLYGVTSSGDTLRNVLASVEVVPIPGRVGQQLRNELLFETRGGGYDTGAEYKLEIAIRESDTQINVERDGDPRGRVYQVIANFKLVRNSDQAVVLEGRNFARAAYRRFDSIYANLRARRDAENRAAKDSARSINARIAAVLSKSA